MLVVTVAVLQLREVLHPDVLANFVRPHEPRPDLLATLLGEEEAMAATDAEIERALAAKNDLEASAGARRTTHEPSRNLL